MLGKLLALLALCPAIGFGTVGLETLMGFSFKDIFDTSKLKGTGYASHRIRIHTADDHGAGTDETVGLMFCTDVNKRPNAYSMEDKIRWGLPKLWDNITQTYVFEYDLQRHFDCTGWFDIDGNLENSAKESVRLESGKVEASKLKGKLEQGQLDDEPFLAPRLQSSLGHYGDYEYLYVRMKDEEFQWTEDSPWKLHKVELQPFVEPYIHEDGHPQFYAAQEWKLDAWFGRCFRWSPAEVEANPPYNDLGCKGKFGIVPPELKYWKWGPFKRAVA